MVSFCFVAAPDGASKIGSDTGCQPKAREERSDMKMVDQRLTSV